MVAPARPFLLLHEQCVTCALAQRPDLLQELGVIDRDLWRYWPSKGGRLIAEQLWRRYRAGLPLDAIALRRQLGWPLAELLCGGVALSPEHLPATLASMAMHYGEAELQTLDDAHAALTGGRSIASSQ